MGLWEWTWLGDMTGHRLLPMVLAGLIGVWGGVALAQPVNSPPFFKPVAPKPLAPRPVVPRPADARPAETKPGESKPAEAKPAELPTMVFYVAKGDPNACGPGCNEWIAADGKIDLAVAQRLRRLLAKLGPRKLPIFFHSGGGAVLGAIDLGRLIRERKLEVSVARTIPGGCDRDKLQDKVCEALKRSGLDLTAQLDMFGSMCNSACVLALAGGAVRAVPPWVKLGVHAIGIDLTKTAVRGEAITEATRVANGRIVEFLRDMGINKGLFTASNAVPHESARFLQRDELVQFGLDTRDFGETSWWFVEKPVVTMAKGFFVHTGKQQPAYPDAMLRMSCGAGKSLRLTFARERPADRTSGGGMRPLRISMNGMRVDLPYATSAAGLELRTIPLLSQMVDSIDDSGAIEVFGFDPGGGTDPPSTVASSTVASSTVASSTDAPSTEAPRALTLSLGGFSAAYAKLRRACDEAPRSNIGCSAGDLSPRCAPGALRTSPVMPSAAGGGSPAWPSQ
jgi:hypothetical protein